MITLIDFSCLLKNRSQHYETETKEITAMSTRLMKTTVRGSLACALMLVQTAQQLGNICGDSSGKKGEPCL